MGLAIRLLSQRPVYMFPFWDEQAAVFYMLVIYLWGFSKVNHGGTCSSVKRLLLKKLAICGIREATSFWRCPGFLLHIPLKSRLLCVRQRQLYRYINRLLVPLVFRKHKWTEQSFPLVIITIWETHLNNQNICVRKQRTSGLSIQKPFFNNIFTWNLKGGERDYAKKLNRTAILPKRGLHGTCVSAGKKTFTSIETDKKSPLWEYIRWQQNHRQSD